jgi:hypothetical protein
VGEPENPPPGVRTMSLVFGFLLVASAMLAVVSWLLYAAGRLPVR